VHFLRFALVLSSIDKGKERAKVSEEFASRRRVDEPARGRKPYQGHSPCAAKVVVCPTWTVSQKSNSSLPMLPAGRVP
jgi:hypothetical protein